VIRARILGRAGLTPYARHPSRVPALASLVAGAALVALYFGRKENRS